jgi:hypothetical protein
MSARATRGCSLADQMACAVPGLGYVMNDSFANLTVCGSGSTVMRSVPKSQPSPNEPWPLQSSGADGLVHLANAFVGVRRASGGGSKRLNEIARRSRAPYLRISMPPPEQSLVQRFA